MISPLLFIASSGKKGRGVFTKESIKAKTIIEVSPVIVLSAKDRALVEQTKLFDYIFEWGKSKRLCCVALGYLSLYNHDYDANCLYWMDYEKKIMTIETVKDVKKGGELTINYNAEPNDKTVVWFDTV